MTDQLTYEDALHRPDLLAAPVEQALRNKAFEDIRVTPIDPADSDTAAFCARYGLDLAESANCVVVVGKREGEERFAACVVLATTRADVNRLVKRMLGVRKASFAPMDTAVGLTGMEFGAITPIGLPAGWAVYVDPAVVASGSVIIGSGIRGSKLRLPGSTLARIPNAQVVDGLGVAPRVG